MEHKKRKRYSLKTKFLVNAIGILIILLLISILTNHYINKASNNQKLIASIEEISNYYSDLRLQEKRFLLVDIINPNFYQSGKSNQIKNFDALYFKISEKIDSLKTNELIRKQKKIIIRLERIEQLSKDYHKSFHSLVNLIKEKGFKDYGAVGSLREKIHMVESLIKKNPSLHMFNEHMLMLRRHEKDFLLRKDLAYQKKFSDQIEYFTSILDNSNSTHKELLHLLKEYEINFLQVIEKTSNIGFNEESGLLSKMNDQMAKIIPLVESVSLNTKKISNKEIHSAITTLFIVISILSVIIIAIFYILSQNILHSIVFLKSYIFRLGNGELPEKVQRKSNDEISDMIDSVNILVENLKNTRAFAEEVGKGNFKTSINVFNNRGDLGSSLVNMRKRLLEIDSDRKKREIEDRFRNWNVEGQAKFGEILRNYSDDVHKVSFELLKAMINYIDAVQGGVFILHDDEQANEQYYELTAAFAYNRKKFIQKKIGFTEGLIGRCGLEGKTIYMTELPEGYLEITSGLGGEQPNSLLLVPLLINESLQGVIEIASFKPFDQNLRDFIEKIAESFASVVANIKMNQHTKSLLHKFQEQAEEMTQKEEELRQSLEEMHATKEEMQRKELGMKAVFKAIDNAVITYDISTDGLFNFINPIYAKKLQLDQDRIKGKSHYEIVKDNFESFDAYVSFLDELKNTGSYQKKTLQYKINNKKIFFEEHYTPVMENGQRVQNIIVIATDITKRKEENKFLKRKLQEMLLIQAGGNKAEMHNLIHEIESEIF